MSNYLPATLGILMMLMAAPTLANDVSVPSASVPSGTAAKGLQISSLPLPTNHFAKVPTGPFLALQDNEVERLPPVPFDAMNLDMLLRDVANFNSRIAKWGPNPMEAATKASTVGGPATEGDTIDFAALNREGLSRLPLADPRTKTSEMFSIEAVGLPVPLLSPFK